MINGAKLVYVIQSIGMINLHHTYFNGSFETDGYETRAIAPGTRYAMNAWHFADQRTAYAVGNALKVSWGYWCVVSITIKE